MRVFPSPGPTPAAYGQLGPSNVLKTQRLGLPSSIAVARPQEVCDGCLNAVQTVQTGSLPT